MSNSDQRLDQAIDDVAAGMIAGEPSAAFTARVVDRIESLETRPLRWRSLAAATCAAAAAIALILWIKPTPHADVRSKQSVKIAQGARHVDAQSQQVATPIPVPRTAFAAPATARAGSMRAAVTTTVPAAAPLPLEAFAPPRIDIAPVGVAPLAVVGVALPESIAPEALEPVAPVAVTPLSSDDAQRRFE